MFYFFQSFQSEFAFWNFGNFWDFLKIEKFRDLFIENKFCTYEKYKINVNKDEQTSSDLALAMKTWFLLIIIYSWELLNDQLYNCWHIWNKLVILHSWRIHHNGAPHLRFFKTIGFAAGLGTSHSIRCTRHVLATDALFYNVRH